MFPQLQDPLQPALLYDSRADAAAVPGRADQEADLLGEVGRGGEVDRLAGADAKGGERAGRPGRATERALAPGRHLGVAGCELLAIGRPQAEQLNVLQSYEGAPATLL